MERYTLAINPLLSNMEVCQIGEGVGIALGGTDRADLRQIEPGASPALQHVARGPGFGLGLKYRTCSRQYDQVIQITFDPQPRAV